MQNKQRNEEKQYEVIVATTDVFEKEMEEILGGDAPDCPNLTSCTCHGTHSTCSPNIGCSGKEKPTCPDGMVYDSVAGTCVPID